MNNAIVDLSLSDLALAYTLILVSLALSRWQRIGRERQLLWASFRMVAQLLAVGYVLHLVFAIPHPGAILLILLVMLGFAMQVIGERVKDRMPRFYRIIGGSLLVGCGAVTFILCIAIVGFTPWYDPQYLIPLAGMIIGNTMNAASLAAERLASEIRNRREEIECWLCLGATPRRACREAIREAFRAALIPSTNTMAAMGIVAMPGMMTGQILSGIEPMIAVRYQIVIMCAIVGSVGVTSFLIVLLGYRGYFTQAKQLRPDPQQQRTDGNQT
ncbi:MAG: iron export ABC transporter permease subunit FetB [Desulfuromonadales bacterium]|nr:iron export ABC transporter permease subunit FetB [Desulfuromonadales bacterium]